MAIIPIINKDTSAFTEWVADKTREPATLRRIILVVVSVALLLDNMLYMVIVPIIPDYLRTIGAIGAWRYSCHDQAIEFNKLSDSEKSGLTVPAAVTLAPDVVPKDVGCQNWTREWAISSNDFSQIGILFASKAIMQLFCNPITGTIIDRIGYDIPMMIGLMIMFLSTTVFAFGRSYAVMFVARTLQGLGSAFADTSGLAMIADRFTEEQERSKALGIALAFISFGSLVAPPFGGILYGLAGKVVPFIMLAFVALIDGVIVIVVMRPERKERKMAGDEVVKGTPIHRLLIDPYIAICAGALAMSNVSLAFLEPTIADWMDQKMHASSWEKGLVWLPAFLPHVAGVYTTVKLSRVYPQYQWLMAAIGLAMEGTSCLLIPFCNNFVVLMIPISIICYGIALVDTALLPTMGFLVDNRHVSVYGSVYAIADIAYSLAYAFGPIMAGGLVSSIGFLGLNISIFLSNVLYVPILYFLRFTYSYDHLNQDDPNAPRPPGDPKETAGLVESPGAYRSYMVNGNQGEKAHDIGIDSAAIKSADGYGYENKHPTQFEALPNMGADYTGPPPANAGAAYGERPMQYQSSQPPIPTTQHHQPQPKAQWDPETDDPTVGQATGVQASGQGASRPTQRATGRDRTVTQIRKDDYGY